MYTMDVELLPTASDLVGDLVPKVLESAGRSDCADEMRAVGPVTDAVSLVCAANTLGRLRRELRGEPRELCEAMFWAEAAAWAAVRQDFTSLKDHLRRLGAAVSTGAARPPLH